MHEEMLNAHYNFNIPDVQYEKIGKVHDHIRGHHGVLRTLDKIDAVGLDWTYRREHVKK